MGVAFRKVSLEFRRATANMHAGLITSHDLQVCKGECVFGLRLEGVALGKALECRSRERRTSRSQLKHAAAGSAGTVSL